MSDILQKIKTCFKNGQAIFSIHARAEMKAEEFGRIFEHEIEEMVENGEEIESYPSDYPHPSILIYGISSNERPLHIVAAYDEVTDRTIVVTAYHPHPNKWIDYRKRRSK